jgi:hypothetical protein
MIYRDKIFVRFHIDADFINEAEFIEYSNDGLSIKNIIKYTPAGNNLGASRLILFQMQVCQIGNRILIKFENLEACFF